MTIDVIYNELVSFLPELYIVLPLLRLDFVFVDFDDLSIETIQNKILNII